MAKRHLKVTGDLGRITMMVIPPIMSMKHVLIKAGIRLAKQRIDRGER